MTVLTDEEMDVLIEHGASKTIEMPLIKVRNLHSQIEELKKERRKLKSDNTSLRKEVEALRALKQENARLQKEVGTLRAERMAYTMSQQSKLSSMQKVSPAAVARRLKQLIAKFHPDLHPDNPLAHEITLALNDVREDLR